MSFHSRLRITRRTLDQLLGPKTRLAIGLALLAAQVGWIATAQLGRARYFCWAPLHEHVRYRIEVTVNGRLLTQDEVAERYGRRSLFWDAERGEDWELNALEHVRDTVRRREQWPTAEEVRVLVSSRTNGREQTVWHWPTP
jgi:hypothetical protein